MTRTLTATLCGAAILSGCLVAATPSTTLAQAKTVRPAIVLPPPAPPAPPAPPLAGEPAIAPAPVAVPAVAQTPAPPAPPQAPKAPTPAIAPDAPPAPPAPPVPDSVFDANIRVDVTISYQVGAATPVKRSATLVVSNEASRGSLRAGVNVAVPSTTFTPIVAASSKPEGGDPRPMTSYNYRSVGLNVDLGQVTIRRTGSVQLRNVQVEFSAIDEKTTGTSPMPSFPTFSQSLNLTLASGKPLIVAQSVDIVDGVERRQTVEVKATILPGGDETTPRPRR